MIKSEVIAYEFKIHQTYTAPSEFKIHQTYTAPSELKVGSCITDKY